MLEDTNSLGAAQFKKCVKLAWSLGFNLFRVLEGVRGSGRVRVRVSLPQTLSLTLTLGTRKIESKLRIPNQLHTL